MPTERSITRAIKAALDREPGVWHIKYSPAGYGTAGVPDLLCCVRGRFVALEVKQPGAYMTKVQHHMAEQIEAAGGTVRAVRSVDEALEVVRGIITP